MGVGVEGHVVEGGVVLLGGDGEEGEGVFGVGVVAFGIEAVGDDVGDHGVLDGFLEAWGEVLLDGLSEFVDGLFFVWWELVGVVVGGGGWLFHGVSPFCGFVVCCFVGLSVA